MIVIIEVITMYIMMIYLSEMDRYAVMVLVGLGICLLIGSSNG